ncbi:aminotransferase class I/II-fold pyridoxal phosphate-dependent enzyme [Falsarthrobacter nasiphocae]|uniref:N-succinyldiaminopimelate aminotransferase n=1 Tax=Falsarthrobacter nasiphocae TaxID=189863 RepID=A0AAE3YJH7_9MICC|nr:aminotransferase class I/II-fold pyridoxal phosphate-dependent enzyme [Falsarthrobacter nasiphocae]MDR6892846.1 N-succinyldiaminopimelate aminotransferase [Falsarthrobacter nasiphocae]
MTVRASFDPADPPWLRASAGAGLLGPDGRPGPTVFERIGAAAAEHGAINLGQGFPDEDGPAWLLESAARAIADGRNQYAPGIGLPALREAVAAHQHRCYGLELDPGAGVLVTAGATEAIAAALLAFVEPGDEVITFDPSYDEYGALVALARGTHVRVPLESDGDRLRLPVDAVTAAFGPRTRVVVLNDPHNPTGTQFTDAERELLVTLAERHGALIVTDEVYEHQWFARPHAPAAAVPGAFERTLSVSSAGKTFSVTGWKTGWITGPPELIQRVRAVKQYLSFCTSEPYQLAVAGALEDDRGWIEDARRGLEAKRTRVLGGLEASGWRTLTPEGTFFILAEPPAWLASADDPRAGETAALALPASTGVAGIPTTAFMPPGSDVFGRSVRFAFCKTPDVLDTAMQRLKKAAP